MPVTVRIISITFNQPGFCPPGPPPFIGRPPFGPGPYCPPPQPAPQATANVTFQVESDLHGCQTFSFIVPMNDQHLDPIHQQAIQMATQFFNEVVQRLQQA